MIQTTLVPLSPPIVYDLTFNRPCETSEVFPSAVAISVSVLGKDPSRPKVGSCGPQAKLAPGIISATPVTPLKKPS
jgi:hypothetical protein